MVKCGNEQGNKLLTLLHTERPKLHRVLAVLRAIGLRRHKNGLLKGGDLFGEVRYILQLPIEKLISAVLRRWLFLGDDCFQFPVFIHMGK